MRISLTLLAVGLIAGSTFAANINVDAVGVYDENTVQTNAVDTEAGGNSSTLAQFTTDVANAFDADLGGVIDFNGPSGTLAPSDTLTVSFGTTLSNTVVLTNINSGSEKIGQSFSNRTAISGDNAAHLTAGTDGSTGRNDFEFSLSGTEVIELGVTVLSRSGLAGSAIFTVTLDDATTLSTSSSSLSASNGGDDTFFHLAATSGRYITAFKVDLSGSNYFIGIDDIGFITVPEPASMALIGLGGLMMIRRRG